MAGEGSHLHIQVHFLPASPPLGVKERSLREGVWAEARNTAASTAPGQNGQRLGQTRGDIEKYSSCLLCPKGELGQVESSSK